MTKDRELLEAFKDYWNTHSDNYTIQKEEIDSFLATRPDEKEENKWHDYQKETPEYDKTIIVREKYGSVYPAVFDTDRQLIYDQEKGYFLHDDQIITHWMPLPEFNPNQ